MRNSASGQSVLEYYIIVLVILVALLAVNFLGGTRGIFQNYFTKAKGVIVP